MARRWTVLLALVGMGFLGGAAFARAPGPASRAVAERQARSADSARPQPESASLSSAGHAGIDWGTVSDRDLDIASVFLTARAAGVRRALDTLERLAASDTGLRELGHTVAHSLGRFVVARN